MAEDDKRLFEQKDRDLAELYPTAQAWEDSFPAVKRPEDGEQRQQFDDFAQLSPVDKTLKQGNASAAIAQDQQANRLVHLTMHDRMAQGAAEAARDTLHNSSPGNQPGSLHDAGGA